MEVPPLEMSPKSLAEKPVPSGQAACVPKPLKVIFKFVNESLSFLQIGIKETIKFLNFTEKKTKIEKKLIG